MTLSKSQAHYVKAVYELSPGNKGTRICDIAETLSLSKASASLAMSKLEQQGFVYKDAERHVYLTEKGELEAMQMLDKFELVKKFLIEILGVDAEVARQDACAIEHIVSPQALCAICRFTSEKACENCPCPFDEKPNCTNSSL